MQFICLVFRSPCRSISAPAPAVAPRSCMVLHLHRCRPRRFSVEMGSSKRRRRPDATALDAAAGARFFPRSSSRVGAVRDRVELELAEVVLDGATTSPEVDATCTRKGSYTLNMFGTVLEPVPVVHHTSASLLAA